MKEARRSRRIGASMAGRSPYTIVLSAAERAELEHRVACYTLPHKVVQRAKMVLYAAEGLTNVQIADRLETAPEVVARWRRRFHDQRLAGLEDRARSGRPEPARFSVYRWVVQVLSGMRSPKWMRRTAIVFVQL